jgi:hypothetical protein
MGDYNNTTYYDKNNNIIKKNLTINHIYTQFINIEKHKQAYEAKLKRFWDDFNKKNIKEQTVIRTFWKDLAKDMEKEIGIAHDPEYLMVIHEVGYDPSLPRQPYSRAASSTSSRAASSASSPLRRTGIGLGLRPNNNGVLDIVSRSRHGDTTQKKRSSTTRSKSRI